MGTHTHADDHTTLTMLGISPFDHPYGFTGGYERRPLSRRPPEPPTAEPQITTNSTADAYTIIISAPSGFKLNDPRASLVSEREMELAGVLKPATAACEFVTLGRTAVYARPSGRQVLGVVPPRTVLSGEPWNHGWVALDNEEGWVHGNDLRMLLRPAPPRRFARSVDVPTDALTRHATSCVNASGSLHITVPRRESAARAAVLPDIARFTRKQPPTRPPTRPTAPRKPARSAGHAQRLPASTDGPVLAEVAASDSNVQLPQETTQHWHASACGGFVTSEAA